MIVFFLKGTLVVFVIGFCGNVLCLLVLCRRRKIYHLQNIAIIDFDFLGLRRNSYTQYLIALAIVDTGAILSEGI